jgi:hypothetical protein
MPVSTISGLVYDADDNSGLAGWTVTLSGDATDSGTTDSGGHFRFDETVPSGTVNVTVTVPALTGWTAATDDPVTLSFAGGTNVNHNFGFYAPEEWFRRGSRWVDKVGWLPGRGVLVQFKNRRGAPNFCCYYPGTTYQDYLAFRAAPSLGRHVRLWYYYRPYVTIPIGS